MSRKNVLGTVYLLHFESKVSHAQHYLGWTEGDVLDRVQTHIDGNGNPLVAAASARGGIELVRTWSSVDRHFERKLKNGKCGPRLCPTCKSARKSKHGNEHLQS